MTDEQRKQLRQKLEDDLVEVQEEVDRLEEMTQPIPPDSSLGRLTRMDAINNKSANESALRAAQSRLMKLKDALAKVDNPNFGICVRCKKPIPFARLMFLPESTTCVACVRR